MDTASREPEVLPEVIIQKSSSAATPPETPLGEMLPCLPTETEPDKPLLGCVPAGTGFASRKELTCNQEISRGQVPGVQEGVRRGCKTKEPEGIFKVHPLDRLQLLIAMAPLHMFYRELIFNLSNFCPSILSEAQANMKEHCPGPLGKRVSV